MKNGFTSLKLNELNMPYLLSKNLRGYGDPKPTEANMASDLSGLGTDFC